MTDALSNYQSAPYNGVFSQNSLLIDAISAAPYEGLWVSAQFLKNACIETEGTFGSMSFQLYGTNLDSVGAVNQYTATIGGSVTTGDVVTLKILSGNIHAGSESVSYTTVGGDTTTTIATALAAAINADTVLNSIGVQATSAAAVITITFPSAVSNINATPSSPFLQNQITISSTVSGSATETVTVAVGSNGIAIGSAITSKSLTNISPIPKYIKARLTAVSGGNATVALQGNA